MAGMAGSRRQTANRLHNFFRPKFARTFHGPSLHQFGQRRTASHRGHTSFGEKADFLDASIRNSYGELQDVAACRILHLNTRIRVGDVARISWMLKVIQELGRIHPENCNARADALLGPISRLEYVAETSHEVVRRGRISIMAAASKLQDMKNELESLTRAAKSVQDLMSQVVNLLHERLLNYNWVGFYLLEPPVSGQPPMLVLGAFQGATTPHTRIPMHQGICGAAASAGKTVVVDDVAQDSRYLACSIETKSEIVVPIFVRGKVVGELDIDSHIPAAFQDEDRELVEYCAVLVGQHWEKSST
jgi:L-methionine (R)-S-oxide reductase